MGRPANRRWRICQCVGLPGRRPERPHRENGIAVADSGPPARAAHGFRWCWSISRGPGSGDRSGRPGRGAVVVDGYGPATISAVGHRRWKAGCDLGNLNETSGRRHVQARQRRTSHGSCRNSRYYRDRWWRWLGRSLEARSPARPARRSRRLRFHRVGCSRLRRDHRSSDARNHMPLALESLAALIQDSALASVPTARMERLRLHIADTMGMMLEGAKLAEGKAAFAVGSRLAGWCASVRLTEADDIHLRSCTTPGSVVVPAALHLTSTGVFQTFGDFVTAVLAGYETLIRVGYAIHGPYVLASNVWPTLFAAGAGAAAVACRAWKLNVSQTAGALSTALAASTGIAPPAVMENSSRWVSLGSAAERGVADAIAATLGALGDPQLFECYRGHVAGVRISARRLLQGTGPRFLFDEIGLKPYPIARQALAAVEACRQLAGSGTKGISAITVSVPAAQSRIIDRPALPSSRMQSIASVQYQIALALLSPDRLMEFDRTLPFQTEA